MHNERVNADREERLRAAHDSENQIIHLGRGAKKEATVNGPCRDFDEGAGRDETKGASHGCSRFGRDPS